MVLYTSVILVHMTFTTYKQAEEYNNGTIHECYISNMTLTTCEQVVEYNTGTIHECHISTHDLYYV